MANHLMRILTTSMINPFVANKQNQMFLVVDKAGANQSTVPTISQSNMAPTAEADANKTATTAPTVEEPLHVTTMAPATNEVTEPIISFDDVVTPPTVFTEAVTPAPTPSADDLPIVEPSNTPLDVPSAAVSHTSSEQQNDKTPVTDPKPGKLYSNDNASIGGGSQENYGRQYQDFKLMLKRQTLGRLHDSQTTMCQSLMLRSNHQHRYQYRHFLKLIHAIPRRHHFLDQ